MFRVAQLTAFLAIASASTPGWSASARAAANAYAPPDPTPIIDTPPSIGRGSSTSPLPVISKLTCESQTSKTASSRRKYLSVRHAFAKSTHARVSCPGCSSKRSSSLSRSVKASAALRGEDDER